MFETTMFRRLMKELCKKCHENSKAKGFWDEGIQYIGPGISNPELRPPSEVIKTKPWNFAEKIALIHSELSEALEAHRNGNPDSKEIGGSQITEELADVVIRVADLCGFMNLDLGGAIIAKMHYNESRPMKHNKAY